VVKTEISAHFYRLEIKSFQHPYRRKIKRVFLQTERSKETKITSAFLQTKKEFVGFVRISTGKL